MGNVSQPEISRKHNFKYGDYAVQAMERFDKQRLLKAQYSSLQKTKEVRKENRLKKKREDDEIQKNVDHLENGEECINKKLTQTIPRSVEPLKDWTQFEEKYLGTHYMRSLTFGGDLIASVKITANNKFDMERIKGALSVGVTGSGGSFEGEIKGRIIGMMEAGWSARQVARQLGLSDCVVRRCWDQWIQEMSFIRRSGSGRPRQINRQEDHHNIRNAHVQPTVSSAAIQTQVAPSLGAPVSS
ncbi:transposable element Tcb2 transposase [Trichonephila clavipes]|nr:transposable element Tcb2 transposase [Trichonephila clavipes]